MLVNRQQLKFEGKLQRSMGLYLLPSGLYRISHLLWDENILSGSLTKDTLIIGVIDSYTFGHAMHLYIKPARTKPTVKYSVNPVFSAYVLRL